MGIKLGIREGGGMPERSYLYGFFLAVKITLFKGYNFQTESMTMQTF